MTERIKGIVWVAIIPCGVLRREFYGFLIRSVASEREHGIALLTEAIKLAPDKAILYALRAKALAHNDMLQR